MEILTSSGSWIIALGKTLLNSLWLGLILISLLKLLVLMIPQRFPGLRYHAALLTLFTFAVLTGGIFLLLYSPAGNLLSMSPNGIPLKEANSLLQMDGSNADMRLYRYISLIYIAGIVIYLAKTIIDIGKIRSIRRSAKPLRGTWHQLFMEYKAKAGIRRNIHFLESESTVIPFLTGVIKPAIIVPAAMLSQLSPGEIESILMHELYHLKRLDNLVNLIQRLLEIIFFFNPAIWILSELINSEREKRCDDLVLKKHAHPLDYARALYHLSLQQGNRGYLVSAATGKGKGELKGRIERILKPNTMKINYKEKANILLIFLCGLAVIFLVSGFTAGLSISQYGEAHEETSPAPFQIREIPPDTISREEKQRIKEQVEEAMAEIDWEQMKKDMEDLRSNVLEEIDWEKMKKEMEEARHNAMAEIDWEQMKKDMEDLRSNVLEEIDWEKMKKEMEEIRVKIDLMFEDLDLDFETDRESDIDAENQ